MTAPAFVCPRCANICSHPLEIFFRWCPKCAAVTGTPVVCQHSDAIRIQSAGRAIQANQDDCMMAIRRRQPLPVRAVQALPPWRAVLLAEIALCADVGLEKGTFNQLKAEAAAVHGDGRLGDWWLREAA